MVEAEAYLRPLAELVVRVGVNLQENQTLWIMAQTGQDKAVRAVAEAAYDAGARMVRSWFHDDLLDRMRLERSPQEALAEFPQWMADGLFDEAQKSAAFLTLIDTDPEVFSGVAPERIATARRASQSASQAYTRLAASGRVAWSCIPVPSIAWAKKVFPDRADDDAKEALARALLIACRAEGPDPVAAWWEHVEHLQARKAHLQDLQITALHFEGPGTHLRVELPSRHRWLTVGEPGPLGYPHVVNIPSEEVFTAPLKVGVEGTVRSSLPLSYDGQLIQGIELTFQKGRVTRYRADQGEDALREILETDEGSHYLGEVALVPADSAVAAADARFESTLLDENAACHLALGFSYPGCFEGGDFLSQEELEREGGNVSMTHVDFMIGSPKLNISADTPQGVVPILREGRWA